MKKGVLSLVFALGLVLGSFGFDFSLSAGGGVLLGMDITRYTSKAGIMELSQSLTQFNYGGLLFFDATFAEFSLAFQGGTNTFIEKMKDTPEEKGTGTEAMLRFSLLGKYPFVINEQISIFPLLGIEYRVALIEFRRLEGGKEYDRTDGRDGDKDNKPFDVSAWNALWIDLGVGLDYALGSTLYLRGELLYGFRLQTPYEVDRVEFLKNLTHDSNPSLGGLTSGPTLKIALGYKFKEWK